MLTKGVHHGRENQKSKAQATADFACIGKVGRSIQASNLGIRAEQVSTDNEGVEQAEKSAGFGGRHIRLLHQESFQEGQTKKVWEK